MSQQTLSQQRVHHFYVAIAKYVFHHPEHGIVSVKDPIRLRVAEEYGLSPLILYGVTVAGLPIRWMTFSLADHPKAFQDVLQEGWQRAEGLRGRPDILLVSRQLAIASPNLAGEMAKIGVRVEVADAREKSLPASLRSAQGASQWLWRKHKPKDLPALETIRALCENAQYDYDFHESKGFNSISNRKVLDRVEQWLALPVQQPPPAIPAGGLDWQPGPWLTSWEAGLPPSVPQYFRHDGLDGQSWLQPVEQGVEGNVEYDDAHLASDYDNAAEIVKLLVACWPNPPAEIARSAGLTLRKLQWHISGKAPLDRHGRRDLEALLGIEYDEGRGEFVGAGPYALIARKTREISEVYDSISKGGDACPCEILPSRGAADPSWHYVLINTFGEPPSIVLVARGENIVKRVPDLLLNYEGSRLVEPALYRDIVATCSRACREPTANIREMTKFVKRYEQHWINAAWLPE
jgi:hypothetical protein